MMKTLLIDVTQRVRGSRSFQREVSEALVYRLASRFVYQFVVEDVRRHFIVKLVTPDDYVEDEQLVQRMREFAEGFVMGFVEYVRTR